MQFLSAVFKKPTYFFSSFQQIELRVGLIQQVQKHPESDKLYILKIKTNSEPRVIATGLQKFIKEEDMKGLVVVIQNLKKRKIGGYESHGMLLCSSNENTIDILRPHYDSHVGELLYLEGTEQVDKQISQINQKNWEKVQADLQTNESGEFTYQQKRILSSKGCIISLIQRAKIS